MNLGNLMSRMRWNRPLIRPEGGSHPLETGLGIFQTNQDLYGDESYRYYVLLINLFDRAILQDNLHTLSIEQQELLELYFEEAHEPTLRFMNYYPDVSGPYDFLDYEYDFSSLTKHIQVLDHFLGGYIGEDSGDYARYGQKQFHRKRKPFSQTIESINRA